MKSASCWYIMTNAHELILFPLPALRSQAVPVNFSLIADATIEEGDGRHAFELVRSVTDRHLDLLRPSAQYFSMFKGQGTDPADGEKGKYKLIPDEEDSQLGIYDKPLPCFGCGIGWFSFLVGFLCTLMWYYASVLYLGNHYHKDPRERAGLAASAIAALACSVIVLIIVLILLF